MKYSSLTFTLDSIFELHTWIYILLDAKGELLCMFINDVTIVWNWQSTQLYKCGIDISRL